MIDLIKVDLNNDRITVSARDLHNFLDLQERFSKWFERMQSYGLEENLDYTPYQKVHPQNLQNITDYQLTVDSAKEISMLQRNEKGKYARKYFIELEKQWNSPEKIMARALLMSKKTIDYQTLKIEQMRPKVLFADSVSASHTSILVGDLAKILKQNGCDIGQNRLFEELRNDGFLIKRKGSSFNVPTQKSMDLKLLELKERTVINSDGSTRITKTPKITGKGQIYFVNKYLNII